MKNDLIENLLNGERFPFSTWPNKAVPIGAGVYTIWEGEKFVYVGMSGRAKDRAQIEEAQRIGKKKMLRERLGSHASGRRSGDQFCVYVSDRLVLVSLTDLDIARISDGRASMDSYVKAYIHKNLSYRFVETIDGATAAALEDKIRSGVTPLGSPLLNATLAT